MSIDALLQAIMGSPDSTKKGGIAEQTGLSAGLAQSAIALVMGKLLAGNQAATKADTGDKPTGGFEAGVAGAGAGEETSSLAGLLERMRSQGAVDAGALQATGLPQELSAKAGIDLPQAIKAIEAILGLLTGKKATTAKRTTKPKAKAKTTTKPKAATKAKSKTTSKTKAKPKTAAKSKSTTKPKATTKSKTKPKTATKAKAKPKTTTKAKAASKSKTKASTTTKSGDWTVSS